MWLQRFTQYLLHHRWLALFLTAISAFIPIVGIVGIVYATLVTLRKGIVEGIIFTVVATLPPVLAFYIPNHHTVMLPVVMWIAVGVAVLSNLLTWVFAVMWRKRASFSLILQVAALVGVLTVSIVHLAYPTVADWWGIQLQAYYKQATTMTSLWKVQANGADAQLEVINITKQYATGLIAAGILFNALLQLIMARWWLGWVFYPGNLHKDLQNIRLSQLASLLFVISLALSYLGNSVVLDIMPLLYALFCVAGLSLLHCLLGRVESLGMRWFGLSAMYLALMIFLPVSVLLISALAVLDAGLDVRKRLNKA